MESKQKIYKIALIRHGETVWNKDYKYAGWVDIDLSDRGVIEVKEAAMKLKDWKFDVCHTSMLKRAIKTWNIIADLTDQHYVRVEKHWRLNEKHFGVLQGQSKKDVIEKYGETQERQWTCNSKARPPLVDRNSKHSGVDKKYKLLSAELLPLSEVL
jgi:2,3-bisphosphoglycerate-dependent phosphoglycerate mutase